MNINKSFLVIKQKYFTLSQKIITNFTEIIKNSTSSKDTTIYNHYLSFSKLFLT